MAKVRKYVDQRTVGGSKDVAAVPETLSRGQKRRVQIVEVAAKLFHERGYHETSMEVIAEAVGVRKASLYYYFTSKDQLLVEIHQDMIDLIIEQQQARVASDMKPTEQLLGIMTDLIQLMESHPGHLRIFFEHFRELPPDVRHDVSAKRDQYRELLVDVLTNGRDRGDFAFDDPFLTAMSVLGVCNWTYQWFRPGGESSAAQVASYFHLQVLSGIAAND
jgi:AcrR family transcriptional regulator